MYGGYQFEGLPQQAILEVTTVESDSSSQSSNEYYYYDEEGNYRHYVTGENPYHYVNNESPITGALIIPDTLQLGLTWTNDPLQFYYDDTIYDAIRTMTVVSRETISVPFGNVETYKINYTLTGSMTIFIVASHINITGTIWFNPQIGIIKILENGLEEDGYGNDFSYTQSLVLTGINWDID